MKIKFVEEIIASYKVLISLLKIFLASVVIYFHGSLIGAFSFIANHRIRYGVDDFFIIPNDWARYLIENTHLITYFVASAIIILSLFEIYFSLLILMKKPLGEQGLFYTSIVWVPFEILLVSKFLLFHRGLLFFINLMIIFLLYKIILARKKHLRTI